jgi:hypothetical protein
MRRAIGSAVVGLLGVTALSGVSLGQAWSSSAPPAPSPPTRMWVHLDGAADLEHLRATNFNHYLRAKRILAAANEICQPGPAHHYPTRFDGDYLNCESMWFTSNPPKKLLTFHLEDVGYIALVSVTVSGAKLEALAGKAATAK